MASIGRSVFLVAAVILAIGLVIQVFLAGLGVFASDANFLTHRDMGYALGFLPLVMIVSGLIGRVGRRLVILSLVVGLLFGLQSVFVALRTSDPSIAALHPVNGFLMLLLSLLIVRDAWTQRRAAAPVPTIDGSSG